VNPIGRIDPLLKPDVARDLWNKLINEYSRVLGSNLVYAVVNKLKAELGLR
jgi:hypothetical protein